MDKNASVISSIERALDIILLLYREKREMGIGEISRALGIYKSTVHRTLSTLEQKGFVTQLEENGKYWLGMRLYSIGMVSFENNKLNKIVQPYAKELLGKYNETITVSVLNSKPDIPHTTVILKEEAVANNLRTSHEVGGAYPVHITAVGKAILAYSAPEVFEKLIKTRLEKSTEYSIVTPGELQQELELIRERGYALDNEEAEIGLKCIAVPIFDGYNKILAAMSISGPAARINLLDEESVAAALMEAAAKISERFK